MNVASARERDDSIRDANPAFFEPPQYFRLHLDRSIVPEVVIANRHRDTLCWVAGVARRLARTQQENDTWPST